MNYCGWEFCAAQCSDGCNGIVKIPLKTLVINTRSGSSSIRKASLMIPAAAAICSLEAVLLAMSLGASNTLMRDLGNTSAKCPSIKSIVSGNWLFNTTQNSCSEVFCNKALVRERITTYTSVSALGLRPLQVNNDAHQPLSLLRLRASVSSSSHKRASVTAQGPVYHSASSSLSRDS